MPYLGAKPTPIPLTSSDITDGIITGAKIETNPTISGNLTVSGTANVTGVTTLSDNIVFGASSKGVHLGVTSATASNLLDDYEEGTWTPLSGGGSGSTAYYTKVGRLVQIEGDVTFSGNSGSTNFISGLPFAPVTQGGAICVWQNIQSGVIGLLTGSGGLYLYNGQTTNINLGTGKRIIFSVTYYTS